MQLEELRTSIWEGKSEENMKNVPKVKESEKYTEEPKESGKNGWKLCKTRGDYE